MSTLVKLTYQSDPAMLRHLMELPKRVRNKLLAPAVRKALQPIARAARAACPVATGALRASIKVNAKVTRSNQEVNGSISAGGTMGRTLKGSYTRVIRRKNGKQRHISGTEKQTSHYARVIEFGGRYRGRLYPAQPFLRPAMESGRAAAFDEIGRLVKLRLAEAVIK